MSFEPLSATVLRRVCGGDQIPFATTADLTPLEDTLGQGRALEAIDFGIGMPHDGYNLFVTGSLGVGKHQVVEQVLMEEAEHRQTPKDYCYVHNFDKPYQPNAIALKAGLGSAFCKDMNMLVERLLEAIPATFQCDDYRNRRQEISDEYQDREQELMENFAEKARAEEVALMKTPMGFTLGPLKNGKMIGPDEYENLDKGEQKKIEEKVGRLNEELREIMQQFPKLQEQSREKIQELNREFAHVAVDPLFDGMKSKWRNTAEVKDYLDQVRNNVLENITDFLVDNSKQGPLPVDQTARASSFIQYNVNLLVDNGQLHGAPTVYEDNPTYQNIIGRIEHVSEMGTLTTNFTLIKAGALHQANGGYLILDARKLLSNPFAWEALKRVLRAKELRLESLQDLLSLTSIISLEPEPIPLDIKVILFGERLLYFLLKEYDPEFTQLFKVQVDFNESIDWSEDNIALYSRLIARLIRKHQLLPFSASAVGAVIEQCARLVEDSEKLTLNITRLTDLLHEADYWAKKDSNSLVADDHVRVAVDKRRFRHGQIRERMLENIQRRIVMIETSGSVIGQANGLAVYRVGDEWFGKPNKITATARPGNKGVLDIERETDLGGPLHSKGMLILSSFLANRYGQHLPLALSASVVFEQSYGPVDGDSASAIELCVLLSAIGEIPLKQCYAVTGSVNQHGELQAIGGVNDKIEGYYDVCMQRQSEEIPGVIIPAANRQHLMLRADVVDACHAGSFRIYAVATIDELMSLLTGVEAGIAGADGDFPSATVNHIVHKRLRHWYELLRRRKSNKDETSVEGP